MNTMARWFTRCSTCRKSFISSGLFIITFVIIIYVKKQIDNDGAGERISTHLRTYLTTCEFETGKLKFEKPLCPCLPPIVWTAEEENFKSNKVDYSGIAVDLSRVNKGSWNPQKCTARQHIAIIIPAKNRDEHLHHLLKHLHPFLQSQLLEYSIFVVDQLSPSIFNKAATMNAAYLELKKIMKMSSNPRPLDCIIFHDVDQLTMDNRNMFTCFLSPLHLGGYRSTDKYGRGYYADNFGGITSLKLKDFEDINGYSNLYWGWGGEDNNFGLRVLSLNKGITKYPHEIGLTYGQVHGPDTVNPHNVNRRWEQEIIKKNDGLNSVRYNLVRMEVNHLYTKLIIDLDPLIDQQMCSSTDILTGKIVKKSCITVENIQSGKIYCCHNDQGPYCCSKPLFFEPVFLIKRFFRRHPIILFIFPVLGTVVFLFIVALKKKYPLKLKIFNLR